MSVNGESKKVQLILPVPQVGFQWVLGINCVKHTYSDGSESWAKTCAFMSLYHLSTMPNLHEGVLFKNKLCVLKSSSEFNACEHNLQSITLKNLHTTGKPSASGNFNCGIFSLLMRRHGLLSKLEYFRIYSEYS